MKQSSKHNLLIVGPCTIYNHLLAAFLDQQAGWSCTWVNDITAEVPDGLSDEALCLFYCINASRAHLVEQLRTSFLLQGFVGRIVLVGLTPGLEVENSAINYGVHGFLYLEDDEQTLLKALKAVATGEIWIPRKLFRDCLSTHYSPVWAENVDLTCRELEILKTLAKGLSNEMIAEELCISPHTVKTHLSNIFKKIKVRNRRHAAKWLAEHLCSLS